MSSNIRQNVVFKSPASMEERTGVAQSCIRNLHIEIPALLDNIDNHTEVAYTGWPDRLYVIDRDGKVAYKSKPGPFGFDPADMRMVLQELVH